MPNNTARTLMALAGASLLAISAAAPALAQTDPPSAAQSSAEAAQGGTEFDGTVTVTALRREQLAKDVPVAVSAISGEKLDAINSSGLDIRFLSGRVPSLQIESSFGRTFPRFYIRGLGNTDFDPNAQQPVSVVYDEVALENPMLKAFPVFDLASVEVLRGPQGTLFGRNTPAGVVKLDSAKPDPDKAGGHVSMSLATYNTLNVEAAANVPLGGGFALRVSGLAQRRDNWVTNTAATGVADAKLEGYDDQALRAQLGYSDGALNALLNVHVRDLTGSPRIFRAGLFRPGTNDFNAGFDPKRVALDGYTSQSLKQFGTNLRLDYHYDGIGTLYSVTAFEKATVESTGDIDGGNCYSFIPGCTLGAINVGLFPSNTGGLTRPQELSQEVRFASEDMNGLRLGGGVYFFDQTLRYNEFNYAAATGDRAADNNQNIFHDNINENYGVFASIDYQLGDLALRAGGRYSHDHKIDRVSGFSPNLFGYVLPIQAEVNGGNFTWDASATYALSPEVNVYGRVATGYQGPAIQDRVTFGSRQTTAPKQTTISGEGGIKGTGFDRRFNFALDAYYFRTDDLQVTAVGGATNSARLLSADHAVGYGVEAEIEARPVPRLALTASGSYNFTEIRDSSLLVGRCANCTLRDPLVVGSDAVTRVRIDGNDLPQAPRWVANWTARYGVPVGDGEVFAFTDWAYRSSINFFLYDSVEFEGKAMLEGGLRAGYRSAQGLEIAAFARNITNQYRSISGIDFNNLTGMISEPRIIGGEVKFAF